MKKNDIKITQSASKIKRFFFLLYTFLILEMERAYRRLRSKIQYILFLFYRMYVNDKRIKSLFFLN